MPQIGAKMNNKKRPGRHDTRLARENRYLSMNPKQNETRSYSPRSDHNLSRLWDEQQEGAVVDENFVVHVYVSLIKHNKMASQLIATFWTRIPGVSGVAEIKNTAQQLRSTTKVHLVSIESYAVFT